MSEWVEGGDEALMASAAAIAKAHPTSPRLVISSSEIVT